MREEEERWRRKLDVAWGREARPPLREGEGETEGDMKELGHVCRE